MSNKKIVIPPVENKEAIINTFTDKLHQFFDNTKVVENADGSQSVELEMDDRIVTFIIDQSGSMTWNDNTGIRHEVAKEIIDAIEQNYPGEVKYNLIKYGSIYANILFFGLVESDVTTPSDINSLKEMLFDTDNGNFAGVRVVRNIERTIDGITYTYPTSPIDGEIVEEGFISKVLDENLEEGITYYYTVYTFDKNYKFSNGVNIFVTPRARNIPRGVASFKSLSNNSSQIGYGVKRDLHTLGIWHLNEASGQYGFDFSYSKSNLYFEQELEWMAEKFVPEGTSAIRCNGENTTGFYEDNDNIFELFSGDNSFTFMGWVRPLAEDSITRSLLERSDGSNNFNYLIGVKDGNLIFQIGSNQISSNLKLLPYQWNHIAITYNLDSSELFFHINGNEEIFTFNNTPLNHSFVNAMTLYISNSSSIASRFYGNISDFSIHNITRSNDYILNHFNVEEITDANGDAILDEYTGEAEISVIGSKEDNGDRINIFEFLVSNDSNFLNGNVYLVANKNNIPNWHNDGDVVSSFSNIQSGTYYVTDVGDFIHNETYYYKIFSQNTLGNFSYTSDSPFLEIKVPKIDNLNALDSLESSLEGPSELSGSNSVIPGNKKVAIKWDNSLLMDNRVIGTRIFYSYSNYPFVDIDGNSNGMILYTATLDESYFIHKNLNNNTDIYYTVVNIDKFGRVSSEQIYLTTTPLYSADETKIPLSDVEKLTYEQVNNSSISLSWDINQKDIEDIDVYFDDTVVFYASITDEFGQPLDDDSLVSIEIAANINKEDFENDVFVDTNSQVDFNDDDAYSFVVSRIKNGVIKATLNMSRSTNILSFIKDAEFTVRLKSYIPNNYNISISDASNEQLSNNDAINNYVNLINDLIVSIDGESVEDNSSENIFEYYSKPITVKFTNPWQIELLNRDNKKVYHRCYYYTPLEDGSGEMRLSSLEQPLNGIYMRASYPFVARAKVYYKGEAISSGQVNVAVWDADVNKCSCATSNASGDCYPSYDATNVSETVFPPSNIMEIKNGFETVINSEGEEVQQSISYVDIPLYSTNMPRDIKLFVKGTYAGYSSLQSMGISFESILQVDVNSNEPKANGGDIAEQQSNVYIINPDYPFDSSKYSYPTDDSIVKWDIVARYAYEIKDYGSIQTLKPVDIVERSLYSLDNVPLGNGIYSYTRNGLARNVFLGPIKNRNKNIEEVYEIKASVAYNGLTNFARQEIMVKHKGDDLNSIHDGYFLMEMNYPFKQVIANSFWANGEDYQKIQICRDASIISTEDMKTADLFRECVGSDIFELNSSGQIVILRSTENDVEFLWGDIEEQVDEYTGKTYLLKGEDSFSSFGEANVQLNDESVSDITTVYIRANSFRGDNYCEPNREGDKEEINLPCMDLNTYNVPLNANYIYGETVIFVNGKPMKLKGGGDFQNGIPPCPICLNEPLNIKTISTKVNGENTYRLGDFKNKNKKSILTNNSIIDIKVEVTFAGDAVSAGTPVYAVINKNNEQNTFIATQNIVPTYMEDERSYADIRVSVLNPATENTITEKLTIFTTYDKLDSVSRKSSVEYDLVLPVDIAQETIELEDIEDVPEKESEVYSKTMERYDINTNTWEYVNNLNIKRSNPFVASSLDNKNIYVFGGVKNNNLDIISESEYYEVDLDNWNFINSMPTPRFAGMTVNVNDVIYTIGGISFNEKNNKLQVSRALESYNEISGWQTLTSMPIVNEGTLSETSYGICFGFAIHVVINSKNYIYVVSGIREILDSSSDISFENFNDRILRYCIEDDIWEYTDILYQYELEKYQRISPLAFKDNEYILLFNGAALDGDRYIYLNEICAIEFSSDIENNRVSSYQGNFGSLPIPKFQSGLVAVGDIYYVLGGSNLNSFNLDIIEKIDVSSSPYNYINSNDNGLLYMLKGRNSLGVAYGVFEDEYGVVNPSIYIVGGKTSGRDDGYVDISFG